MNIRFHGPTQRGLEAYARAAGASAILIGVSVLAGWTLGIDALKRVVPGTVCMNPLTACCMALCGAGLVLLFVPEARARAASRALGVVALACGFLRIGAYLLGVPDSVDTLFFTAHLFDADQNTIVRMAPNTALNISLVGTALALGTGLGRRATAVRQVCLFAVAISTMLALLGYGFGATFFYQVGGYIPMALHTAYGLLVLATGLLAAEPTAGAMDVVARDATGGVIARRLLPLAVALPVVLAVLRAWGERRGYYDTAFGIALTTVATIVVVGAAVWMLAQWLNKADAQREAAEAELKRFFTLASDCFCVMRSDGVLERLNDAWLHVLGYAPGELVGRRLTDLAHPDEAEAARVTQARFGAGEAVVTFEGRYRHKDGSFRWLMWSATMQPESRRIYGVARDVTARKQEEALFRGLLEAAPDAMVIVGQDGRIALVNEQAERVFGYTREEMLGQAVEMLVPEASRARHPAYREAYTRAPTTRPMGAGLALHGLRKDGTAFPAEISLSPLASEQGMLITAVVRDVTERNRIQEELRRKNALLQAANEELEGFSYSVSHDLRAPLRHINGFVDLLKDSAYEKLEARPRRYLEIIATATRDAGKLIDDLLVFSRMGRVELLHADADMQGILDQALKEATRGTEERHVEWTLGPMPAIRGDAALLRQVWVNLLSNALKYTRPRDPAIIEIGHEAAGGQHVFHVRDNGVGFDMKYVDKLFGVFQRLHRADQFEGTGVGLANVRRIVHRHGGRTWAEAAPDKGATFYFSLPA
jgi:PAS domain S-box-containing protein